MNKYGIRPIKDDNDEAFKLIERARIALGVDTPPEPAVRSKPRDDKDQNGAP